MQPGRDNFTPAVTRSLMKMKHTHRGRILYDGGGNRHIWEGKVSMSMLTS